jgi:hypothetical protein
MDCGTEQLPVGDNEFIGALLTACGIDDPRVTSVEIRPPLSLCYVRSRWPRWTGLRGRQYDLSRSILTERCLDA